MTSFAYRVPLGALLLLAAGPALADHMGPSGFGSGGGMSVFSPDTLDGGHWAAGLRLTYTRPEQRSDATLEALAARHIHAHNTDYNFNASVGIAYGVSHHLTISVELPYVRRDDLREGEHSHSGGTVGTSVEQLGSVAGIGDLNLLAKYRLTEGRSSSFALIAGNQGPDRKHAPAEPGRRAARDRASAGDRKLGPDRRRVGLGEDRRDAADG